MKSVTYTVIMVDGDTPPEWFLYCSAARPGNQDSGRVVYTVTTTRPGLLETALDRDDDVIRYQREGGA